MQCCNTHVASNRDFVRHLCVMYYYVHTHTAFRLFGICSDSESPDGGVDVLKWLSESDPIGDVGEPSTASRSACTSVGDDTSVAYPGTTNQIAMRRSAVVSLHHVWCCCTAFCALGKVSYKGNTVVCTRATRKRNLMVTTDPLFRRRSWISQTK